MPTNIDEVKGFLDEYDLKYHVDAKPDTILIGFEYEAERSTYRDHEGEPFLRLVIRVLERGEFVTVFAPNAWNIEDCPYKAAVFEALAAIQLQYKMLRFDYDPSDGEIRPNIELPLEDAAITSRQFHRLIHGVFHGVGRFDRVIRRAMETGEVSFEGLDDEEQPSAATDEATRLEDLARRAGGIDELEKLIGGDGLESDAA